MAITKATASSIAPAAKGDLVVGSATNDASVLAVGTNTHVLTADSTTTTGLKWAAPATGALTKITSASFSAVANTSTTFDNIFTSTYKNYQVIFIGSGSTGMDLRVQIRINSTTQATGYDYGSDSNSSQVGSNTRFSPSNANFIIPVTLGTPNQTFVNMYWTGVGTATNPAFISHAGAYGNALRGYTTAGGIWNSGASDPNGLIFTASTGTITGTVFVYGLAD